jgi:hypothetical protein
VPGDRERICICGPGRGVSARELSRGGAWTGGRGRVLESPGRGSGGERRGREQRACDGEDIWACSQPGVAALIVGGGDLRHRNCGEMHACVQRKLESSPHTSLHGQHASAESVRDTKLHMDIRHERHADS